MAQAPKAITTRARLYSVMLSPAPQPLPHFEDFFPYILIHGHPFIPILYSSLQGSFSGIIHLTIPTGSLMHTFDNIISGLLICLTYPCLLHINTKEKLGKSGFVIFLPNLVTRLSISQKADHHIHYNTQT